MHRSVAALSLAAAALLHGQSRFEVASVKPSPDPSNPNSGGKSGKGRLTMTNVTLKRCIMGAYAIGPNQLFGGPDWLESARFEIVAKAEQPTDDDAVLMAMLQTLLADRFKLALHRESRTMPAIVLEVAKGGPKLEKSVITDSSTRNGRGLIDAKGATMDHFAEVLSRQMDVPVINRTGLDGIFDLKLEWIPESSKPADDTGPSIFTAIQSLGLRLRSQKVPVEVIVIDHAEKPTAN